MGVRVRKYLVAGVIVGVWSLALGLPSTSRAQDPIEKLREALKNPGPTSTNAKLNIDRGKRIESALGELKTISQRRRAFFLTEWSRYNLSFVNPGVHAEMTGYRKKIGDRLIEDIEKAAKSRNPDDLVAVAIMIAELAETEQTAEAKTIKGTFVRGLTATTVMLAESDVPQIRQAALNALGKITPNPEIAMPIIKTNIKGKELGPQRLAAYALVDLVKKAQNHPAGEDVTLLKAVIDAAVIGLEVAGEKQAGADEPTRGYCLEAIQESAMALTRSSDQFLQKLTDPLSKITKGEVETYRKGETAVLTSFKAANDLLVASLTDSKIHVRLAALEALDEISIAHAKLLTSLEGPDPLAGVIEGDWRAVAPLLSEENPGDVQEYRIRLRRRAIAFFEQLGEKAAPAEPKIADALRDEDRFVKWTAMRVIRNIPAAAKSKAIQALALNLLTDNDADLSAAAADALEAIGAGAQEAAPALTIVIRSSGVNHRVWDVENREKAMKALVSIGSPAALPDFLSVLDDADVRVRRRAADSIGQLGAHGQPVEPELLKSVLTGLRKRLQDDDSEVRLNASEAILSLTRPK